MPRPLRIAVFTGDFYPEQVGGQGIYAYEVATRTVALGHHVTVLCPFTPLKAEHRYPPGLEVQLLHTRANPLAYGAALAPRQATVIRQADVLHVNELFGLSASLMRPASTGLIISSHNSYLDRFHAAGGVNKLKYLPLMALERLTYPRADRLLIGSEIEREPSRKLGVPDSKIRTVPYGVDATRFVDATGERRRSVRAALGIPAAAGVALFVGRFVERKKPHVVARAMLSLASADPLFHGVLIGDGEMMRTVREVVGHEPRIHLLGAVPFDRLPDYYVAADAFTLPSVGEGSISLVVLEAAAAGLPLVLTADSCGDSPVFEAGRNGELVALGDAAALADGLRRALERRREYGERSRALVEQHFSWDACARQTVACYEEVANHAA